MAENVQVHGDLASLSNTARCGPCQVGGHRCVFAKGDPRCIPCATAQRDCMVSRPVLLMAPASTLSWDALCYKEGVATLSVPSGTTRDQLQRALASLNNQAPQSQPPPQLQHQHQHQLQPNPPPVQNTIVSKRAAAASTQGPINTIVPKVSRSPKVPNGTSSASHAAPEVSNTNGTGKFGVMSSNSNELQPLPEKRTRLRSALSLESLTAKGDACDDCRKHKRKCLPAHKIPVPPAKPSPVYSPAQRSPSTNRFTCAYSECEKDFTFMGDLQRHTREIHGVDLDGNPVVPHYCPVKDCSRHERPFARRDNLRQHLEKRHGMSPEEADASLTKKTRTGRRSNAGSS